ncbi:hypothetical protein J2752_000297 [Halarchaeum rubridurum]|uniref:Uncharacterized protein n=1 Tax=Halarchaeum rubridurum TaxID=489911 RepID=A0A830FZ04_9EURY|nr:hypothetical protein [Halarchaeum rubridurum]MBP1953416.1 hypothetical protein [Halarchaeum rubridurum]GGM65432.1 hypothetical protein GCM10009017_14420 [Halarchaeum rubridurum]
MPSRRAFLTGAGATALVTLTGCSSRETSDDPSTTSESTTPDTLPPDAASFEADLVRDATADHPPRFAATLTNEGSDPFTATFGFAPPLSVTTLDATEGDASLFCYPVSDDARQHVQRVAIGNDTASDLPPERRADGCWRVTGSYSTDTIAYARTLDAGESLRVAYDAYTYGDGSCFPNGDYRATTGVSVYPGTSADGATTSWSYGVTLALRDGSVSSVAGSDVRAVALTDE